MGLETIAIASLVAGAASTGVSAMGAISQSQAASQSAKYNAQIQANNATISQQNASFAASTGEQQVAASESKTRAQVAATLANQGASGIDVNSGSTVDVRASESALGALNASQIRSEAARNAYGYQTQAQSETDESQLYKSQAKNDTTSGYLNAGATVLGGIGKAASGYSDFLQQSDPTGGITGETYGPFQSSGGY